MCATSFLDGRTELFDWRDVSLDTTRSRENIFQGRESFDVSRARIYIIIEAMNLHNNRKCRSAPHGRENFNRKFRQHYSSSNSLGRSNLILFFPRCLSLTLIGAHQRQLFPGVLACRVGLPRFVHFALLLLSPSSLKESSAQKCASLLLAVRSRVRINRQVKVPRKSKHLFPHPLTSASAASLNRDVIANWILTSFSDYSSSNCHRVSLREICRWIQYPTK